MTRPSAPPAPLTHDSKGVRLPVPHSLAVTLEGAGYQVTMTATPSDGREPTDEDARQVRAHVVAWAIDHLDRSDAALLEAGDSLPDSAPALALLARNDVPGAVALVRWYLEQGREPAAQAMATLRAMQDDATALQAALADLTREFHEQG